MAGGGHTAHATQAEAEAETLTVPEVYRGFCEESWRFPDMGPQKRGGTIRRRGRRPIPIEGLMGDGARVTCNAAPPILLGQLRQGIQHRYLDDGNELDLPWQTSWGFSTRLLGAIIMVQATIRGCGCRPRWRQFRPVMLVPIGCEPEERDQVLTTALRMFWNRLEAAGIRAHLDDDCEGATPRLAF